MASAKACSIRVVAPMRVPQSLLSDILKLMIVSVQQAAETTKGSAAVV